MDGRAELGVGIGCELDKVELCGAVEVDAEEDDKMDGFDGCSGGSVDGRADGSVAFSALDDIGGGNLPRSGLSL